MESLTEEDMRMESAFVAYCNIGISAYFHFSTAQRWSEEILGGRNPVSYPDFMSLQLLSELLRIAGERCDLMKDETDLPYLEAGRYIECMLDECSILMRTHLSKLVTKEELCYHLDFREFVDADAFNKLFLPDFAPEVRREIIAFQNRASSRGDILYALLIVSSKMKI
ncbi:MAG: hypothetical protein E7Z70_02960 [Thermoplasmata archaeon]|nr:hypothetical protein [Thermoplasmata archaeon]